MSEGGAPDALLAEATAGSRRALGRLITIAESGGPSADALDRAMVGRSDPGWIVGIVGAPGVGKSTLTGRLAAGAAGGRPAEGAPRVAVIAVDPSSPLTGGAILGDRIRMQGLGDPRDVFVRSMAHRGAAGGLAGAVPIAVRVLGAVGVGVVIVETVGVGQIELEIVHVADTVIAALSAGWGDAIQASKAGLLEVADLLVVNKCDRDGADDAVRELRNMIATGGEREPDAWRPVVVRATATVAGGIDELVEAVDKHRAWLASSGEGEQRRIRRAANEIRSIALAIVSARIGLRADDPRLAALAAEVAAGRLDPYAAAQQMALVLPG